MTQDRKSGASSESEIDRNVTLLLREGSDVRPRSQDEIRSILGSTSETVEVRIVSELQLVSRNAGCN